MKDNLVIVRNGFEDSMNILSEAEEEAINGGDTRCTSGYAVLKDGSMHCDAGYSSTNN